ncbi:putative Lipid A core-O-antigen ligase and related enzyme [Vibrio nigripulchritudo SO65]|uniref:O-antigen ligase family protein n=1 Tax=Vibrio nigripulchritudo TaxID=28173 RepID=UPI0003B1A9E2|nr:O-antigen ligase family protein [Vibrio nigripulchritudo]CCN36083.1 putative Lipid A core-O-antigen ligase and related enzyme [Vibrio nigripulchritudo AM115]CCN44363.1 putative Lipid A core-O-antigen ligase and related enzyme [Vibrio nigripulchritudo FTn2]CCN75388.1 putative Lipid A core-O-antigen ligase and related enzyme [Vibrio nigripulchritudo SO65]
MLPSFTIMSRLIKQFTYRDSGIWLVLLPITIAVTTCVHWNGYFYSHDVPKWLFIDVLLSMFVLSNLRKLACKLSYISFLFGATAYWIVASFVWSSHVYAGIEFLFRFVLFGLSFSLLVTIYNREQRKNLLLSSSVLSATLFSITFFIERWMNIPVNNGAFTPIGFTNNAGHIFNIWIPALCYIAWCNRFRFLWLLGVSFVLLSVLHVLNISHIRTTVIALVLGGLVFLLLLSRHLFKRGNLSLRMPLVVIGIALLVGYSTSQSTFALPHTLSASVSAIEKPLDSYRPRLNMVLNSWDMLKENPFGVGANNFEFQHPEYAKVGTHQASEFVSEKQILKTPHNFLAKVFTELGWIGGILFSLIYLWLIVKAFQLAIAEPKLWWVFVALFAFLIHSLLSQVFLSPMSYIFAILLFAVLIRDKQEVATAERSNKVVLTSVAIFALIVPALSFMTTVSHFYHYQGVSSQNIEKLEKSVSIYPGNEAAWLELSMAYFYGPKDLDSAITASESFLFLNPNHIYGRHFYGMLLVYNKDCAKAVQTLGGLLKYYPSYKKAEHLFHQAQDCSLRQQNELLSSR